MSLLFVIIRILVILLVIRYVLRVVATARIHASAKPRPPAVRKGGTLVRDPHCGTYLPESRAITAGRGAGVQHFCSAACRDAYALAHRDGRFPDTLRTP